MTLLIAGWSLTSIWYSTASTMKTRLWRFTVCCEVLGICRGIWNKFRFECCGQCSTKCKPLTKVSGFSFYVMQLMLEYGELGTRTAAEPTAACGGNREARLGPRSDFSRPRQGAVEKSVNATRQGGTPQIQLLGECLPGKLNPDSLQRGLVYFICILPPGRKDGTIK